MGDNAEDQHGEQSTGQHTRQSGAARDGMKVQAAGSEHDVRCRHTSVAEQQGNGVGGVVQQSSGQQRATAEHQRRCGAINKEAAAVGQQ